MIRFFQRISLIVFSLTIVMFIFYVMAILLEENNIERNVKSVSITFNGDSATQSECTIYETRKGQYILGKSEWYVCDVASDCTYSESTCNYVSVAFKDIIQSEQEYLIKTSNQCGERFGPPVCDMGLINHIPICSGGKCAYKNIGWPEGIGDGT